MKLLHLSDLHIGKRVYEFSMLEDQRYILDEILGIVDQERPDGVLLAGDIYDKTVPSGEAVQVLDGFLTSLADRGIPVFLISGNHDSPERIAFGAELMSGRRVYVSPVYDGTGRSIVMEDQYGRRRSAMCFRTRRSGRMRRRSGRRWITWMWIRECGTYWWPISL